MKTHLSSLGRKSLSFFTAAVLFGGAWSLQAAPTTNFWALEGDGNWHLDVNWNPANIPNEAGSKAIFDQPLGAVRMITLDAPAVVGSLEMGNSNALAGYTIAGPETLTLDNNGLGATIDAPVASFAHDITAPLVLADDLTIDNGQNINVSQISESVPGRKITKEGAGVLRLLTATTLTGGFEVNGGTLRIQNDASLGEIPAEFDADYVKINNARLWFAAGFLMNVARGIEITGDASIHGNSAYGVYGEISGTGRLVKSGTATLFLATNYYTGGTWLQQGSLKLGSRSPTWSQLGPGDLTVEAGTAIFPWSTTARTLTNRVIINGNFQIGSSGSTDRSILTLSGPIELGSETRQLTIYHTNAITGVITGGTEVGLIKTGPGELRLTGQQEYTGNTVIREGTLSLNNSSSIDSYGAIPSTLTRSNLVLDGGAIRVQNFGTTLSANRGIYITENGGTITGRTIATAAPIEGPGSLTIRMDSTTLRATLYGESTFSGGVNLEQGRLRVGFQTNALGSGPLTLADGVTIVGWTALTIPNEVNINGNITIGSQTSGETLPLTFSGPISIGDSDRAIFVENSQYFSGPVSGTTGGINKAGSGLLVISGPTSFSGPIGVLEGELVITTDHTGGGNITVADGMALGIVRSEAAPTLATSTLNIGNGSTIGFYLPNGATAAPVIQAGDVFINGLAFAKVFGGKFIPGTYPLVKYTSLSGSFDTTPLHLPGGVVATIENNLGNSSIDLVVTSATGASLTWSGAVNGTWDFSTLNWSGTLGGTTFGQGDSVILDDSGSTGALNLVGNFEPGSVVANNNSLNYSLSGAGSIGGSGSFTKSGSADLTINNANSYSGGTEVNGGILRVNNVTGSATGSGAVVIKPAGILEGNGSIAGPVSVEAGGMLAPGSAGIGTLTVNNNLTLQADSTTAIQVNAETDAHDSVHGVASMTFGGNLVVENLGGTFAGGESFQLFQAQSYSGDFAMLQLPLLDEGLTWNWSATTGVLSINGGMSSTPTNILFALDGNTLSLSWPESHLGWLVQSNSVNIGDTNFWFDIQGTETSTNFSVIIDPAMPNVFYRMRKP